MAGQNCGQGRLKFKCKIDGRGGAAPAPASVRALHRCAHQRLLYVLPTIRFCIPCLHSAGELSPRTDAPPAACCRRSMQLVSALQPEEWRALAYALVVPAHLEDTACRVTHGYNDFVTRHPVASAPVSSGVSAAGGRVTEGRRVPVARRAVCRGAVCCG